MALTVSNYDVSLKRITCDRTMEEIKKPGNKIGFVPGILDLIEEESLPDGKDLDDESYSLEVASLKGINTKPTFFIVLSSEKEKIEKYAKTKGYNSLSIYSPEDFNLDSVVCQFAKQPSPPQVSPEAQPVKPISS